jgi:hypothetical protein
LLNSRLSTKSIRELEDRISNYIDFYNNELLKAHNWQNLDKLFKVFAAKLDELNAGDQEDLQEPEEDESEVPAKQTPADKLKKAEAKVKECQKKYDEAEQHIKDLEEKHCDELATAHKDAEELSLKLEAAKNRLDKLTAPKAPRKNSKSAAATAAAAV